MHDIAWVEIGILVVTVLGGLCAMGAWLWTQFGKLYDHMDGFLPRREAEQIIKRLDDADGHLNIRLQAIERRHPRGAE